MNEEEARRILQEWIGENDSLNSLARYVNWPAYDVNKNEIVLDDKFTANELEAMVWWMRNK